jgi:hypothetical protein
MLLVGDSEMLQHGDLLFTQIGSDQNAISAVTEGYCGARVNHVGIVVKNNKGVFVLEAFPPEVRVTQLAVFLRRSNDVSGNPRYIGARLKPAYTHLINPAIQFGLSRRDTPYDVLYLNDELALYCSELLVDMFKTANNGTPFFTEHPMSFRDLVSGEILPAWVEYYERFGMDVPDGEPGSNPGDISKDVRLVILQVVGSIAGYIAP